MKRILLILSVGLLVTSCSVDKQDLSVVSEKETEESSVLEEKNTDNNILNEDNKNYSNIFTFSKTGDYTYNVTFSPDKGDVFHTEYITDKGLKKQVVFKNGNKFYECNDIKSFYVSSSGTKTEMFKFSNDGKSLAFICDNGLKNQVILNGESIGDYQEITSFLFDNKNQLIFGGKNNEKAFLNIGGEEKELNYEYLDTIILSYENEVAYNIVKDNKIYLVKGDMLLDEYDYNQYPVYSNDGKSFAYRVWNGDDRNIYIVKDGKISNKYYRSVWESYYSNDNKLYTFVENNDGKNCLLIDFEEKECHDNIFVNTLTFSKKGNSYMYLGEKSKGSDMSYNEYKDGNNYYIVKDGYKTDYFYSASMDIQISENGDSYGFWAIDKKDGNNGIYKDGGFLNDEIYYFTNGLIYGKDQDYAYIGVKKLREIDGKDQTESYLVTNKNTYGPFETFHHYEYGDNGGLYFFVTNKEGKVEYNKGF